MNWTIEMPKFLSHNGLLPSGVSVSEVMANLDELARRSPSLVASHLRNNRGNVLPRYIFLGPRGGGDPIRISLFAGIHGDEQAGTSALIELARHLERFPELARGYELFLYPVCNPSGFDGGTRNSRSGKDLNREFWRGSGEWEVQLLEQEIRQHAFHGLISLHADDTSDGVYGFVRGAVLTRALLEPALRAAERHLPLNRSNRIDGFPAANGIINQCYEGVLTSPPDLLNHPFEIILETPQLAPEAEQVQVFVAATISVLSEYQKFLAFGANL